MTNSIDYWFNEAVLEALHQSKYRVVVSSSDWEGWLIRYDVVILGGQNAPEGIGEIVSEVLSEEEKQQLINSPDAFVISEKQNPWNADKTLTVLAGHEKEQTRTALHEYLETPITPTTTTTTPKTTTIASRTYICSYNKYNCANFRTQWEAQRAFKYCGGPQRDIHRLDGDNDGIACEHLP